MANLDENIIDLNPEQPIPPHLDTSQINDDELIIIDNIVCTRRHFIEVLLKHLVLQ